jgi:hypothetical protein
MNLVGTEARGFVSSSDAHAGVEVPLFDTGGNKISDSGATITLSGVLAVTDIILVAVATGAITLTSITATGTVTLFSGTVAANFVFAHHFETPIFCLRGGTLTLTAAAGQVDLVTTGIVIA